MRSLAGRGLSDAHVPLVVGLTTIAIWLAWVWRDGGFFATEWGILGALLLLVVALGLVWGAGRLRPRTVDARLVAFVALAGFVVWSYLSIAWAGFPGESLTGANKTLLYAASFVAFATFSWAPSQRVVVIGAFALGIAGIGAVWLTRVASSAEPDEYFVDGRLSGPVEYVNASVAVWTLGALAAFHFASSRHLHAILRGLFLGVAVLLLQLALLGQSRAWVAALPATVFVYVLLSRDRPRLLLSLALASAAVLASLPTLLDVEPAAGSQRSLAAAVDRAVLVAAVTSLGAACAGTVSALLDRRTRLGIRARRGILVALGAALILAAGVGAAAARSVDDPGAWLSGRWEDFSAGDYPTEGERFGSLGSNRLEEWRVAWDEFEAHPVHGIGADNYAAAYLRERDNDDYHPRYPHSTPLRHLSQLGLVGTALFAAFFGAAVLLALRRRRDVDAVAGAVAASCLAAVSYWLLHGTADWLWEVPAVTAPAFGLLGLAGAPVWKGGDPGVRAGPGRLAAAVGSTVLLIGLAALVFPWLAATYQASGIGVWRSNPDLAHVRLERAAELNPLSAEPLVADGAIGIRTGNFARAERAFIRARERESENWYVHFELGLIDGSRGRREAARSSLNAALALNPQEPAIRRAIRLVKAGRRPDPQRLGVFVLAGDRREATGR